MRYVLLSLMLSGCVAHSPVAQSNCCQRLDIRTVEMQRYYRFCKTLAKGVVNRDPKALRNRHVPGLLEACRYVFDVNTNVELLRMFSSPSSSKSE
jgi:hypothetical protein